MGFYVNCSTRAFDSTPKSDEYYNLIDLIAELSPSFKKELNSCTPLPPPPQMPATVRYNYKWLGYGEREMVQDAQRSEGWALDLHGLDVSSLRDWNEELQVFRSLPRTDLI